MTAMSEQEAKIKDFLDMISPSIIKFNADHIVCGNTYRCVWALREYPTYFLRTMKETILLDFNTQRSGRQFLIKLPAGLYFNDVAN